MAHLGLLLHEHFHLLSIIHGVAGKDLGVYEYVQIRGQSVVFRASRVMVCNYVHVQ